MSTLMKVPFVDMARTLAPLRDPLHRTACGVIDSTRFIGGPEVKGFEREMAQWLGVDEVCAVGCCTSGLYVALRALGIGPGDEVITTVHTAIPTSEAITMSGADVVFCDIEPEPGCYNMDPDDFERKITPRTKAVIVVHLYGQPAQLEKIIPIARKHNLRIIEDCAQAQGSQINGRTTGTFGDAAAFSFFPSKNLGGFGDGGAVTAKDPAVMRTIRMIPNHGRLDKYNHEFEGMNSRLDALQAAMLRVVLPSLEAWNKARHTAAAWYRELLQDIPGLVLPRERDKSFHVYHVFVVQVPDREQCAAFLAERGVETGVHYPMALNLQPAYAHLNQPRGCFPHAEQACDHVLSLPMSPSITREEVAHVCEQLRDYFSA